jgi:hypothetical protein
MIIVDEPDRDFATDEQWLRFYDEMQRAMKKAARFDDVQQIGDLLKRTREVLAERKLTPQTSQPFEVDILQMELDGNLPNWLDPEERFKDHTSAQRHLLEQDIDLSKMDAVRRKIRHNGEQ